MHDAVLVVRLVIRGRVILSPFVRLTDAVSAPCHAVVASRPWSCMLTTAIVFLLYLFCEDCKSLEHSLGICFIRVET